MPTAGRSRMKRVWRRSAHGYARTLPTWKRQARLRRDQPKKSNTHCGLLIRRVLDCRLRTSLMELSRMTRRLVRQFSLVAFFVTLYAGAIESFSAEPDSSKLRIIVFGAHPDDAEFKTGGTAIKWAKLGHEVKLVSVTN